MDKIRTDPAIAEALPGETIRWSWTSWPEDVLDALDLVLVYLGVNTKLKRPGYKQPMTFKNPQEVLMRRALPHKAFTAAVRLVCPGRASKRPQTLWYIPPKNNLKARLAGAGIDVDTVQVINQRRWAFAYFQLNERMKPHYNSVRQETLVNTPGPEPDCSPVTREVTTLTGAGRRRIRKERMEKARYERSKEIEQSYPNGEIADHLNARRPDY
jgi:hypothetical protein